MEFLVGALFILLFFGFIPYQVFKTAREKAKYRESSGDTLRRSELEEMMRDTVEDALEPYRGRLETLEALVTNPDEKLDGRIDPSLLLDDPEEEATRDVDPQRLQT